MFSGKSTELFTMLGEAKIMCLATSDKNRVSARSMSVIIYDKKLYFQTDKRFLKYSQLTENPRAALCWSNVQLEGVCEELGHFSASSNEFFAERFKKHYKGSYEAYSHLKSEVVFELSPTLVTVWDYDEGRPFREFYDFSAQTYAKEYYDCTE